MLRTGSNRNGNQRNQRKQWNQRNQQNQWNQVWCVVVGC